VNNDFYNILVSPKTKEKLIYDSNNNRLISENSNNQYEINNSIPILLNNDSLNSKLHDIYNSSFNYQEHYQKDADYFDYTEPLDGLNLIENRLLHNAIIDRILPNNGFILDVGCGNGWLSEKLAATKLKIISMDISTTNPSKALRNYPFPNHFGLVADAFNLPIKNNSIKYIVASEIMEHVAEPKLFISELFRVLKTNGKLIISVPYNEKIEYSICVHCNKPTPRNAHLHSFNENNISEIIPKNAKWSYTKINNKFLFQLRIVKLFDKLPYKLWKKTDMFVNRITNRPLRLIIEIKKLAD